MGLAYNLDTTQNPYLSSGLSNYFVQFPNYLQWRINFTVQGDPTKTAAPNGNVYPAFNGNLLNGTGSADDNPDVLILGNPANDGSDPPLPPGGFTNLEDLPTCFFTQSQTSMINDNGWLLRWCGRPGSKYQWQQAIFPTGEYIIRDITFINGYYAIVGSYKARFMGLYNNFVDGNNYGDTWDGFVMMYRAYSDNVFVPFDSTGKPVAFEFDPLTGARDVVGSNGIPLANSGIGILPMRMPYNILPHDDRTQISDMDDVGLYTVDVWRNSSIEQAPNAPGSQDPREAYAISLWLGGTQAVGETELTNLGIPYTNVDRLAYAMVGTFANLGYLSTSQYGIASEPVRLSQNRRIFESFPIGEIDPPPNSYAIKGGTASVLIYDTRASDVVILAYGGKKQSLQPTRPDINDNEVGYPLGFGGVPTANQRGTQSLYGAYPPFSATIWPDAAAGGGNQFMYDSQGGGLTFLKTSTYYTPNPLFCSTFIANYSWGKCLRNKTELIGNMKGDTTFTGALAPGDDGLASNPDEVQRSQVNNQFTGPRFFCLTRNLGADELARGSVGGTEFSAERFYAGYYADYERQFKDVPSGAGANTTAYNANYYMKCFYDIQAFNSWYVNPGFGFGNLYESPAILAGSVWVGTDDPSAPNPSAKVYPTFVISAYPSFYTNVKDTQNPIMNMPPLNGRIGNNPAGGEDYAVEFAPLSVQGGYGPYLNMASPPVLSFVAVAGSGNPGVVVPPIVQATIRNGGGGSNWTDDATNLKNAYFAFCTVPYEDMGRDFLNDPNPDPSNVVPLIYFYCNNITYDNGEVGTGIFSFNNENPYQAVVGETLGMFFNGQVQGGTNTPIPIVMPNKWTAKIQQTRTFTESEETASRSLAETPIFDAFSVSGPEIFLGGSTYETWEALYGTVNPPLQFRVSSGFTMISPDQVVINSRNGEEVGVKGNYPRLGFEPTNTETFEIKYPQQGQRTGEAMGAMGWRTTGTDRIPVVLVFDSGEGRFKNPEQYAPGEPNYAVNYEYSNSLQNRGDKFNSEILIDTDSTKRIALGCSWDNDRDQWIFLFGNYTSITENQSVSIVSVTSTFTDTPRFGSAYLDQTKNFLDFNKFTGAPTEFNNLIFKAFPMTNNLDGMMWFGSASNTEGGFNYANSGDVGTADAPPQSVYAKVVSSGTIANTLQYYEKASNGNGGSYPGTVPTYALPTGSRVDSEEAFTSNTTIWPETAPYLPSIVKVFNLDGSTGREAFVWVDYILFDGADAVIATKLRERGMKVSIEAVEWFKRKIINSGDLNIKAEEIEMWMRQQQDEFTQMMRDAERMGRVRKKKKQVSAYGLDMLDSINTDFEDKEVQEFMQEYLPKSRPPTPEEEMLERQRKGGYSPQSKSYYDEVFEQ